MHLAIISFAASVLLTTAEPSTFSAAAPGGPPRIMLDGRSSGDITAAQWSALKVVGLHGCVPDARITSLALCIKDCKAKDATATGVDGTLTPFMRKMIANLPPGTPFMIKAVVKDAKGMTWDVPEARFVWRG